MQTWMWLVGFTIVAALLVGAMSDGATRHPVLDAFDRRFRQEHCLVCRVRFRRGHGCHIAHAADRVHQGRVRTKYGHRNRWVWIARVNDRHGAIWKCTHRHLRRTQALRCADRMVRKVQLGLLFLPEIGQQHERAATKSRLPITDLDARTWEHLKRTHGYRCYYCGTKTKQLVREHMVPLHRGGTNTVDNIVPACWPCNKRKGTLTDDEFLARPM